MKIVVLTTVSFEPHNLAQIPAEIADKCHKADAVLSVFQDERGESQVAVTVANGRVMPDVEIFDVI